MLELWALGRVLGGTQNGFYIKNYLLKGGREGE